MSSFTSVSNRVVGEFKLHDSGRKVVGRIVQSRRLPTPTIVTTGITSHGHPISSFCSYLTYITLPPVVVCEWVALHYAISNGIGRCVPASLI